VSSGTFRFEEFDLDPADRLLRRGGEPVEVNGRYFDALELLVRERGRLVTKDRFMDEVWRGIPVTDEALTQCIRTLRKQLGDDAVRPRFIETVPKHGYRFIAPVEAVGAAQPTVSKSSGHWRSCASLAIAGSMGGGAAGLIGGLFYGFAASGGGLGSASTVLVLLSVTMLVGLIGAAGVSIGIAAAALGSGCVGRWSILGGAAGGLVVGAIVKLVAGDAFMLLFGQSPGDVTGAVEGALLGAAVGLGAFLAFRRAPLSLRFGLSSGGLAGAATGLVIAAIGGRLMAASLDLVASRFPASRLRLDQLGGLFGESGLGPVSQIVMAALEGALFAACVVGGFVVAAQLAARNAD